MAATVAIPNSTPPSSKNNAHPLPYHPQFESSDANVVLSSLEGTLYRVPSFTLRNTCGYFRNLLSHPQQLLHASEAGRTLPVEVGKPDKVVAKVLSMICGLYSDNWQSIEEVENVLELVLQWDASGPLSLIRCSITAPVFLAEPLRLYAITTRLGWEEEAKLASSRTLALDLYDDENRADLERLETKHLMALLGLHRQRRNELKRLLDGTDGMFEAGNSPRLICPDCGKEINNHAWREMKARIFYELDKRSLGDTVIGLDMEEWPEAIACWSARCRTADCGRLVYDKLTSLRDIKKCIDKLPSEISYV